MPVYDDRIDPPAEPVTLDNPYRSAESAFDAGNYVLAMDMAQPGSELAAAATTLCGRVEPGLEALQTAGVGTARGRLARGYALWCLNRGDDAAADLAPCGLDPAESIDAVLFTMSGGGGSVAVDETAGFRVVQVSVEPGDFGRPLSHFLGGAPVDFDPQLGLSLDAYGAYMPREISFPVVYWASDPDFFHATRHDDFAHAAAVIVNSAGEQLELSRYAGRCATLPGHEMFRQNGVAEAAGREWDALFTGRAFVPYMADKARQLFHLATVDDPDLRIRLIDGYLPEDDYLAALCTTRLTPLFWRYAGGLQTRGIEALLAGSTVLVPETGLCAPLLGGDQAGYSSTADGGSPEDLLRRRTPPPNHSSLVDLCWAPPRREERLLKFAALQAALSEPRKPARTSHHLPVELRGYEPARGVAVYGQIIKANLEPARQSAAAAISGAAAALYQAILLQDNDRTAAIAHDLHADGISRHSDNLIMRFNAACAFHLLGAETEATRQFQVIIDGVDRLTADWEHDAVLSHRIRPLAEMLPYGPFYTAVAEGDENTARAILAATASTYLGDYDAAAGIYPEHPAAWRLLAKRRAQANTDPDLVAQAFYRAVNLYPPVLAELLPIGLKAEEARGDPEAAAEILKKWIFFVERTRDADGARKFLTPEALEAARAWRAGLRHWTAEILDRMINRDIT